MKSRRVSVATMMLLLCVTVGFGQDTKANFTGDWTLDREKSQMGDPRPGAGGGRGRGMGMGSFSITHEGDAVVLKRKIEFQGEKRTPESRYTTDDKENVNEGFRGSSVKSKTRWEGTRLVTESVMETPNGTRETKEIRSLSADAKTMTVETTIKGGFGEGTRKLVYNKKE
ncbi:MAG: hypothetical protein EXQ58_10360 [Acidobacteria bacterium]|nr:hypothetical protein [Acidobacteriota bacterium]